MELEPDFEGVALLVLLGDADGDVGSVGEFCGEDCLVGEAKIL